MFYKFFNKKINDFRWYYWDYIIKNKLQLHFYFYILEMKSVSLFYILNDSTEHITKTFYQIQTCSNTNIYQIQTCSNSVWYVL
jgi:hypothetical protein